MGRLGVEVVGCKKCQATLKVLAVEDLTIELMGLRVCREGTKVWENTEVPL